MTMTIWMSLFLGAVAVFQGVINRQIAAEWGLTSAILLNNAVIFLAGLLLFGLVRLYPDLFPEFFKSKFNVSQFSWYFVLPGLFGLMLVAGIPLAISQLGALNVFVGLVSAQIVVSGIWDHFVSDVPLTWSRVLAASFAILSVLLLRLNA